MVTKEVVKIKATFKQKHFLVFLRNYQSTETLYSTSCKDIMGPNEIQGTLKKKLYSNHEMWTAG